MARPPASLAGFRASCCWCRRCKDGMVGPALVVALGPTSGPAVGAGDRGNHMVYWDHLDELIGILRTFLAAPR